MAIYDAYNTINNNVTSTFWYYLQDAKVLSYKVSLTNSFINFKIIYLGNAGMFLAIAGVNKISWEVMTNNIVRINADIKNNY